MGANSLKDRINAVHSSEVHQSLMQFEKEICNVQFSLINSIDKDIIKYRTHPHCQLSRVTNMFQAPGLNTWIGFVPLPKILEGYSPPWSFPFSQEGMKCSCVGEN